MLFMLAAKEKGWATCPMIGFDSEEVKHVLNISEPYDVVMMITIGKEKWRVENHVGIGNLLVSLSP